jgi:hypothetical protein
MACRLTDHSGLGEFFIIASSRGLQAGRTKPFAHMRSDFRLAGAPQQLVTLCAWRKKFCFVAHLPCLRFETIFEGFDLLHAAPFQHGAPPFY